MATVLVDDTRVASVRTYGTGLARDLANISQLRVNRYSAVGWAQNLRFLVFDNGESSTSWQDPRGLEKETKTGEGVELADTSYQKSSHELEFYDNLNATATEQDSTDTCKACC